MVCRKKLKFFIWLDCDHLFCDECFKSYLQYKIESSDFNNKGITCPECDETISDTIIKNNTSNEEYTSYLSLYAIKNKLEDKTRKTIMRWCLVCDECTIINDNDLLFDCYTCRKCYCSSCKQDLHERGCQYIDKEKDENREQKLISEGEAIDKHLTIEEENLQCPKCTDLIKKEKGCNFIKCPWPKCKGTYFCALCYKVLTVKYI